MTEAIAQGLTLVLTLGLVLGGLVLGIQLHTLMRVNVQRARLDMELIEMQIEDLERPAAKRRGS